MTRPSPHALWQQAAGDRERYVALMKQHGHLIPRQDATPRDEAAVDHPMVRMSVEFLRRIVEPHGGTVQHGPVDADGNVTSLLVNAPPCPKARKDRR